MVRMPIDITDLDARRLRAVLSTYDERPGPGQREVNQLRGELERARLVPSREVSERVVTMRSEVLLRDLESQQEFTCTLSYPEEADIDTGRISVLAPVGTAILGYREGTIVEWKVPAGTRRLRIERILYQPEAAGDFER
jgi:regulator of nucleoside diphosphate kinase